MKREYLVIALECYRHVADSLCREPGFHRGEVARKIFPDGEVYLRVDSAVAEKHVLLIGGTIGDRETLELFDLACGVVHGGARSLTLFVPYFGYSTMERAVTPGEVVIAKNRARLFTSIPPAHTGNRIVLLDLHTEGIPFYFEGAIRPYHLYAEPLVLEAIRELGESEFVVACTDAGRAKWVQSLANHLGASPSFVFKRRTPDGSTEITAVNAQVQGKRVVIYDDMIRTGGSLLEAAQAYLDAGARDVAAVATHGLLPGDSLDRIRASGLIRRVIVTDSHPRAVDLGGKFLGVKGIAPLFRRFLLEQLDGDH